MFGKKLRTARMNGPTANWIQAPHGQITINEKLDIQLTFTHFKYTGTQFFRVSPFYTQTQALAAAQSALQECNQRLQLYSNAYRYCQSAILEIRLFPCSDYLTARYRPDDIIPTYLTTPSTDSLPLQHCAYIDDTALPLIQAHFWFLVPHPFPWQVPQCPWMAVNSQGERLATLVTQAHNNLHADQDGLNCVRTNLHGGLSLTSIRSSATRITNAKQTIYHNHIQRRWEVWFPYGKVHPHTQRRRRHKKCFGYKNIESFGFTDAHEKAENYLLHLIHHGYQPA